MIEVLDSPNEGNGNKSALKELIRDGYKFDFPKYIERAFDLWKEDILGFSLYALVSFLILMVSVFTLVGPLLLGGPLMAGYQIVAAKIARGEQHDFGDFFKGFDYFKDLFIQQLLIALFVGIPFILFLGVGSLMAAVSDVFSIFLFFGYILAYGIAFYVGTIYTLAMPFVVFGKLNAWPAMEVSRKIVHKNFWWFLLLIIVAGFIASAGAIAFIIGAFCTMSLQYIIYFAAYEDIIGLQNRSEEASDVG